jgi:hypothetical protein
MHAVKVQRRGISQDEVLAGISQAVGDGYTVSNAGESLIVRKNVFVRARVKTREEPDGTVFEVSGCGLPAPLVYFPTMFLNERGIAARTAQAIEQTGVFQDAG